MPNFPYKQLDTSFDRQFRNDLNKNLEDIEVDIKELAGAQLGALEAANEAETQAIYAGEQGDYASDKGEYAASQGDYAKSKGEYAANQGDYAFSRGMKADSAANNADLVAGTLNGMKSGLVTATNNANTATTAATTQASHAKTQGDFSKTQGDYAKAQADRISTLDAMETVEARGTFSKLKARLDNVDTQLAGKIVVSATAPAVKTGLWIDMSK